MTRVSSDLAGTETGTGEADTLAENSIPVLVASQICAKIREEKASRFFSQCWGCVRFSGGEFARMCVSSRPDLRGCALVNKEYDRDNP